MKAYTSIMLPLGKDEFLALREISDREYRHPRDQARHLLRCALGIDKLTINTTINVIAAPVGGGTYAEVQR